MDPAGAVALVTGGSSGLGLATVRRFVEHGLRVVLVDLPTSDGAALADELGDGARFAPADITDSGAVSDALDVADELGPLRVVVHCAGIASMARVVGRDGNPARLDWFIRTVEVNLTGSYIVARLAASRMMAHDPVGDERGVIINTASAAAFDGQVGQAAYAASKAGVVAMTLPLARELASARIRVVTIAPGLFATPMLMALPTAARDSFVGQVPHPSRSGDPMEFAMLAHHIVVNPMLNGTTLRLDAALRASPG